MDIDAHHGDAVERAFADDPDVFTLSLHMDARYAYLFEGGAVADQGGTRGGRTCLNVPLPAGTHDAEYALLFETIWPRVHRVFDPGAVVLQAGTDVLFADPLGKLRISTQLFLAVDAFLIDQPEVHIPVIGKAAFMDKLLGAFTALEGAVRDGRIRCYGISSFHCLRAHTAEPLYLSPAALHGLAEKAARAAFGRRDAGHHFRVIPLPFNQVMTEGFTRFNQLVGDGGEMPVLQASLRRKVYAMASHTLLKGRLSAPAEEVVGRTLPALANDAQRAVRFTRSTPGIGPPSWGRQHSGAPERSPCREPRAAARDPGLSLHGSPRGRVS